MKIWMPVQFVGLGIGLLLPITNGPQAIPEASPVVRVSVFDDAKVGTRVLRDAEREAGRVFRRANIEVIWIQCPQDSTEQTPFGSCTEVSYPAHLHLRIAARPHGVKQSTVGMSFQSDGRGCYADLFHEPIVVLQEESHVDAAIILGHAMAHELGHLLLGTNSHSRDGLMRAHWEPGDLAQASRGRLLFSAEESTRMRSRFTRDDSEQLAAFVEKQAGAQQAAPSKGTKGTEDRLGFGRGELDFGGYARPFGSLEVGFVALEAGPLGEEAVGKQADVGVVRLDGVVVALAFHGDAIFGAG